MVSAMEGNLHDVLHEQDKSEKKDDSKKDDVQVDQSTNYVIYGMASIIVLLVLYIVSTSMTAGPASNGKAKKVAAKKKDDDAGSAISQRSGSVANRKKSDKPNAFTFMSDATADEEKGNGSKSN